MMRLLHHVQAQYLLLIHGGFAFYTHVLKHVHQFKYQGEKEHGMPGLPLLPAIIAISPGEILDMLSLGNFAYFFYQCLVKFP